MITAFCGATVTGLCCACLGTLRCETEPASEASGRETMWSDISRELMSLHTKFNMAIRQTRFEHDLDGSLRSVKEWRIDGLGARLLLSVRFRDEDGNLDPLKAVRGYADGMRYGVTQGGIFPLGAIDREESAQLLQILSDVCADGVAKRRESRGKNHVVGAVRQTDPIRAAECDEMASAVFRSVAEITNAALRGGGFGFSEGGIRTHGVVGRNGLLVSLVTEWENKPQLVVSNEMVKTIEWPKLIGEGGDKPNHVLEGTAR